MTFPSHVSVNQNIRELSVSWKDADLKVIWLKRWLTLSHSEVQWLRQTLFLNNNIHKESYKIRPLSLKSVNFDLIVYFNFYNKLYILFSEFWV